MSEKMLPEFIRRDVERAIEAAIHPKGMNVHDGKALIAADRLQYMLNFIDALRTHENESEAGAVAEVVDNKPYWIPDAMPVFLPNGTKLYPAPTSAKAIETAAIMKCAELCDLAACDSRQRILALIPQDGRTKLEKFGMKVANEIAEHYGYSLLTEKALNTIVTNMIGEGK